MRLYLLLLERRHGDQVNRHFRFHRDTNTFYFQYDFTTIPPSEFTTVSEILTKWRESHPKVRSFLKEFFPSKQRYVSKTEFIYVFQIPTWGVRVANPIKLSPLHDFTMLKIKKLFSYHGESFDHDCPNGLPRS